MTDALALAGGKSLNERLDSLADRLGEISHKWENRLTFDELVLPEDYMSGRVTLGLHLRMRHAGTVADESGPVGAGNGVIAETKPAHFYGSGSDLFPRQNDKVVLLPVGEPIDDDNGLVAAVGEIGMSAYLVGDKANDGGERLTYSGIRSRFPHAFFVSLDGQRPFAASVIGSSSKAHPAVVEGGSETVDGISENQSYLFGSLLRSCEADTPHTVAVCFRDGKIEIGLDPMAIETFELIDVLVGPFDLQ